MLCNGLIRSIPSDVECFSSKLVCEAGSCQDRPVAIDNDVDSTWSLIGSAVLNMQVELTLANFDDRMSC